MGYGCEHFFQIGLQSFCNNYKHIFSEMWYSKAGVALRLVLQVLKQEGPYGSQVTSIVQNGSSAMVYFEPWLLFYLLKVA